MVMARKKKNDFWDNVDDEQVVTYDSPTGEEAQIPEDEWSLFKSTPVKVFMRIVLMAACLVALISGYVTYQYIEDRYASGTYSSNFYDSASFAKQYAKSINQLAGLLKAMEADSQVTKEGNEELLATMVENNMGKDTNFSFLIQDADHYAIVSSGDDAKDRIESSTHYALVTNTDGEVSLKSSLSPGLLNSETVSKDFKDVNGEYIIYTAVDDALTYQDSFYNAQQSFSKKGDYFHLARMVGIIALVIFVIALIFCIIATGQVRGYDGVYLTVFDRVFSELAVLIMAAGGAVIAYGIYRLIHMQGTLPRYGAIALGVVAYIWTVRCYFSIVRRIKAARLFRCSIVGTIVRGIAASFGRLPYPFGAFFEGILLILVNAGIVYLVVTKKSYTFHGIKLAYVLAGVAAVIELVGLLSYATGGMSPAAAEEEEEYEPLPLEPEPVSTVEEIVTGISQSSEEEQPQPEIDFAQDPFIQPGLGIEEEQDWEMMDLSKVIASAEKENREQQEAARSQEAVQEPVRPVLQEDKVVPKQKTQVLTASEIEDVLRVSGTGADGAAIPAVGETHVYPGPEAKAEEVQASKEDVLAQQAEESGRVNFVQLNKEVRKTYRPTLKQRGITVAMRAPEKPVIIDMDKSSLTILISNIFDQIVRLSADQVKNYIESYVQDGKVVYVARIQVAEDMQEAARAAVSDGSFDAARKIVEANDGKFVASFEGSMMRIGMLMDAA